VIIESFEFGSVVPDCGIFSYGTSSPRVFIEIPRLLGMNVVHKDSFLTCRTFSEQRKNLELSVRI